MWEGVDNYYIKTLTNRYRVDTRKPIDETGKSMDRWNAYIYGTADEDSNALPSCRTR